MHDCAHPRMPHGLMPEPPEFDIEGVDPLSREVHTALHAAFMLHKRLMMRMFAEEGFHPAQAMCLGALARQDGIGQSEIAEMLHVSRPTVTELLQRLEAGGTIERRADESDQRVTRVYLTSEGRSVAERMRAVYANAIESSVGWMPETDRRTLADLLRTVNEHLRADISAAPEGEVHP